MLRIVLTGPESTGKTTLALKLAAYFGAPWVPEYAREYLDKVNREYIEEDLLEIARGQIFRENRIGAGNPPLLFIDTDLITIKVWSDYKYGNTHPWIIDQIQTRSYDHYFLCGTDIPWEPDPQRENPKERDQLYEIYKRELLTHKKNFTELSGNAEDRIKKCIAITKKIQEEIQ